MGLGAGGDEVHQKEVGLEPQFLPGNSVLFPKLQRC